MFLLFIALLNTPINHLLYLFQFFLFGVNALFCYTCIKGPIFFAYIIYILYFSVLKSTFEVYILSQNIICISSFLNLQSIFRPRMTSAFGFFHLAVYFVPDTATPEQSEKQIVSIFTAHSFSYRSSMYFFFTYNKKKYNIKILQFI